MNFPGSQFSWHSSEFMQFDLLASCSKWCCHTFPGAMQTMASRYLRTLQPELFTTSQPPFRYPCHNSMRTRPLLIRCVLVLPDESATNSTAWVLFHFGWTAFKVPRTDTVVLSDWWRSRDDRPRLYHNPSKQTYTALKAVPIMMMVRFKLRDHSIIIWTRVSYQHVFTALIPHI